MTTSEQIQQFTNFALALTKAEGEHLALDEIFERWWVERHRDDDLAAIQQAVDSYKAGERGRPAEDFLAEQRAARTRAKS